MTNQSRRNFFKSIIPKGIENTKSKAEDSTLTVGHLAVFPVNSSTKIRFKGADLIIESLPEGLRIREEFGSRSYKLSVGNDGLLRAHMNEEWPISAVLSIFTGEIYNI